MRHPCGRGRSRPGAGHAPAACDAHRMKVEGQGELKLLGEMKEFLAAGAGGDDAAVIADPSGFVVASCDMFGGGVHFDLGWLGAAYVGGCRLVIVLGELAAEVADLDVE